MKPGEWEVGNGRKNDNYMGWDTVIGMYENGEKYVVARTSATYQDRAKRDAIAISALPDLYNALKELTTVPGIVDAMPVFVWDMIESAIEKHDATK